MTQRILKNAQVSWAASDGADTVQSVEMEAFTAVPTRSDATYVVAVKNPSADTALTVKVEHREQFTSGNAWSELKSISVATSANVSTAVDHLFAGPKIRLKLTNDAALSSGQGFTADVVIRQV